MGLRWYGEVIVQAPSLWSSHRNIKMAFVQLVISTCTTQLCRRVERQSSPLRDLVQGLLCVLIKALKLLNTFTLVWLFLTQLSFEGPALHTGTMLDSESLNQMCF